MGDDTSPCIRPRSPNAAAGAQQGSTPRAPSLPPPPTADHTTRSGRTIRTAAGGVGRLRSHLSASGTDPISQPPSPGNKHRPFPPPL